MDRETIEAFAKVHDYILPESYINFLLICDNHPEKYCKGYRDIILYSLEELPQERKLYEMDEFCPEYIAIGYGGGGEVLSIVRFLMTFLKSGYCIGVLLMR